MIGSGISLKLGDPDLAPAVFPASAGKKAAFDAVLGKLARRMYRSHWDSPLRNPDLSLFLFPSPLTSPDIPDSLFFFWYLISDLSHVRSYQFGSDGDWGGIYAISRAMCCCYFFL